MTKFDEVPWPQQDAFRVGKRVQQLRQPHSGQWLSDRTHEVGHRISRTVISDLERGKRSYLSTTELVVLSKALNVAPVALLYPPPFDEDVEITPGVSISRVAAADWFSANIDPLSEDHDAEFLTNIMDLLRARQIREVGHERRNTEELRKILDGVIDPPLIEQLNDKVDELSKLLGELRSEYGG